eukprot:13780855-Alexandrium_andersonii.AAC.1
MARVSALQVGCGVPGANKRITKGLAVPVQCGPELPLAAQVKGILARSRAERPSERRGGPVGRDTGVLIRANVGCPLAWPQ